MSNKIQIRVQSWLLALLLLLTVGGAVAGTNDLRLAEAAASRDQDTVRALLKQHAAVNDSQRDGSTALHWAAHWNDLETADLLIRAGANINAQTDLGVSPLYLAAENAGEQMAEELLSAGANPNIVPETGVSPLMLAAREGNVRLLKLLLDNKADVNAKENTARQTALMWAAADGHADAVEILLERGADAHARTKTIVEVLNRGGSQSYDDFSAVADVPMGGSTALLFAAGRGQIDCAKALLEFGANVNDTGADGNSALVIAAHSGQGPLAELLLERGANPNADGAGYTVLHAAVLRGDLQLLKASLAHGANPNVQLKNGTSYRRQSADYFFSASMIGATPLLLAAKYASVDMIRALVAAGADLNLALKDGTTPLLAAANTNGHERQSESEFVKAKSREDEEGQSLPAVKALLDLGADVNAANQAGDTALHIAVSGRSNSIIQLLAERGAMLEVKNKRGQTPLALVSAPGRRGSGRNAANGAAGADGNSPVNSTAELLRKLGAKQ